MPLPSAVRNRHADSRQSLYWRKYNNTVCFTEQNSASEKVRPDDNKVMGVSYLHNIRS